MLIYVSLCNKSSPHKFIVFLDTFGLTSPIFLLVLCIWPTFYFTSNKVHISRSLTFTSWRGLPGYQNLGEITATTLPVSMKHSITMSFICIFSFGLDVCQHPCFWSLLSFLFYLLKLFCTWSHSEMYFF